MKTYVFPIIVEQDEGENWFAEVPMLPGCALSCYPLTRVCKNYIIAMNRPRHRWIPACSGMTKWAR